MVFYRYADDDATGHDAAVDAVDELLRRGAEGRAGGVPAPSPPRLKVAVVTCMDARIDPAAIFGLAPGDAHVIRNAGAWVTDDTLRSLALSQVALGTEAVIVMAHTDCGLHGASDADFARTLAERTGARAPWGAGGFSDLDAHVRAGVERVRGSAVLPSRERVRGAVYDVKAGVVRGVT